MEDVESLVAYKSAKRPVVRAAKRKLNRKKARSEKKRKRRPQAQLDEPIVTKTLPKKQKVTEEQRVKKKKKKEKKVKFAEDVIPAFLAEERSVNPEQMELEYLEKKLKIKRSKNGNEKVARELAQDGFGDEIGSFLLELESGFQGLEPDEPMHFPSDESDDEEEGEEDDEFDEEEYENSELNNEEFSEESDHETKSTATPKAKTPEEMEMEYLEKKLKLKGSKSKKSKVLKELKDDGIGTDLSGILMGKKLTETKSDDEEDDSIDDQGEESNDETAAYFRNAKDSEMAEEPLDENDPNMVVMPSNDLYGRESKPARDGPKFRFKPKTVSNTSKGGLDSQEIEALGPDAPRLRMRLNGLLNRLTEANVSPISTSIIQYYDQNSTRVMNTLLSDLVLTACADETKIMHSLITVLAALVGGLNISVGTEVGAFVVEAAVKRFDFLHNKCSSSPEAKNQEIVSNKSSCNLALFIAMLNIFGVTTEKLVLGLLKRLSASLRPADVAVVDVLLDHVGFPLRSSHPQDFKELFLAIAAGAKGRASGITGYLLDSITALKNNKQEAKSRHEQNKEKYKRLLTWVRHLRNASANSVIPLQVGWDEVLHADERGRWWVVGGVWAGNRESALASQEAGPKDRLSKSGSVQDVLARAHAKLLKGAQKRRLTTDVRKAVFCVLMSGGDYLETFDGLLKLNLRDRQERDIVTVLLVCCRDSKQYNPYFGLVATKLCEYKSAFKFTFQLQFWDTFKIAHELKATKVGNLAKLMCDLTLHFSLSLACLKVIEFTSLNKGMVHFLNHFFMRLLQGGNLEGREADEAVSKVFRRLAESKDAEFVRDGIVVFFRTQFEVDTCKNPKLVFERAQIAISHLEQIGGDDAEDMNMED